VVAGHEKTNSIMTPPGKRIPAGLPSCRAERSNRPCRGLPQDPGMGCFGRSRPGHSMEAPAMKQAYQAQSVKDDARGRWERVLPDLAPALKEAVERRGKHVPCPVHGGRDGFRVFPDVDQTGGGVCNTCGFFADGLSLLMWVNDWDFSRTIREVAEHVGGQPVSSTRRQWPSVASGMPDDATRREHLNRTWRESLPLTAPASRAGASLPGAARSVGNGTPNPAFSSRAGLLRRSVSRGAPSSHPRPSHRAGGRCSDSPS
jgi:hypothetical protein